MFSLSPIFCAVVGDRPHFLKFLESTLISGRLADQGSISGGVISQHKSGGRPNQISRLDDKSGQIGVYSNSGILVSGIQIPSKFSPCTHSGEVAKT